ncbi:MAG: GIY-YIG nuclease family protein [Alphaproteobacteria bacterium]
MSGFVYILTNKPYGTLYIGVTRNLSARLFAHHKGFGSKFAKRYRLRQLVWFEEHPTIVSAIQRETSLKRWKRDWKLELIEQMNPDWRDLSKELL